MKKNKHNPNFVMNARPAENNLAIELQVAKDYEMNAWISDPYKESNEDQLPGYMKGLYIKRIGHGKNLNWFWNEVAKRKRL